VRAAAGGDADSWQELVDGYMGLLWSTVRKYRLRDSDGTDVIQTTWLRLVQNIDRIEDPARVGAWLVTTARREALRVIGQHQRMVLTEDDALLDAVQPSGPGVDARLIGAERDAAVRELLMELPPRCQELLALLTSDPAPDYETISAQLGMPIGSIGPTRGRCLKKLAMLAAERGIEIGDLLSE
jgi:RNA polymerase sigma factor (sigma-70 family)